MVDVVIVTANTRDLVLECVEHLTDPVIADVIVVDNASEDGTQGALAERFPHVKVVRLDEPVGYASGCNRGAGRGAGDYILFLNSDVFATEGAVSLLMRTIEEDPQAVASGGRLVDPGDLSTQLHYRPRTFPNLATFAVQLLDVQRFWPGNPVTRAHFCEALDDETTVPVDQPAGACIMVRRSKFDEIGGFDERYWFWFEDVDIARRLADRGKLLYVPKAAFRHVGAGTFRKWNQTQVVRSRYQGILHYGEVHFSRAQQLALATLVVAVGAPRSLLFSATRPEVGQAYRRVVGAAVHLLRGKRVPPLV